MSSLNCLFLIFIFGLIHPKFGYAEKIQLQKTLLNSENLQNKIKSTQDLNQVFQLAKINDPTWAAAQKSNMAAHEKIHQGRALLLPSANLNLNSNYTDTNIEYTGSGNVFRNRGNEYFDTHSYTLSLRQPIYRPQNRIQYAQSKTQATISDSQLNASQQDLTFRTAQAYFEILIAQNKVELIIVQKQTTQHQLLQAQASYKVGTGTITDVNDAKAKFDLLTAQEISSRNALESKKRVLESIIGSSPGSLTPADPGMEVDIDLGEVSFWEDTAIMNNPNFMSQQKTVVLAQQEVDRSHAAHMPTLDAVGNYGYTYANGGINGFGNKLNNLSLGLQLDIPLFQGGATISKEREASLNFEKARDELEVSKRKAVLQTRQAWLDLSSSVALVRAYEQALISGQSQVDSTKMAYKLGIRNTVDVLNAEQAFYTAKFNLVEARYVYLSNIFKLKTAAGVINENDIYQVNALLHD